SVKAPPSLAEREEGGRPPELFLLHTPDLLVFVLITIARIEDILRTAILVDIGVDEQMHIGDEAGGRLAGNRPVHLVDALPAMQMQRLGDGGELVLLLTDALESGH